MLVSILLVGAGSFIGGILRYLLLLFIKTPSSGFPLAVFLVNVLGCFVIGLCYGIFSRLPDGNSHLLLMLTTGVCGGFTTFSTFANDSFRLLENHQWVQFSAYAGGSVILGILAVMAGHALVHLVFGR